MAGETNFGVPYSANGTVSGGACLIPLAFWPAVFYGWRSAAESPQLSPVCGCWSVRLQSQALATPRAALLFLLCRACWTRFSAALSLEAANAAATVREMLAVKGSALQTPAPRKMVAAKMAALRTESPEAVPAGLTSASRTKTLGGVFPAVFVEETAL